MSTTFRVVPDTNIWIAAQKSKSPTSPNQAFFRHWQQADFDLLYSEDTLHEYVEKLTELAITEATIKKLLQAIIALGIEVPILYFHLRYYPEDPDDIAFLLCAVNGDATHLVSQDQHLLRLNHRYSFAICKPADFLGELQTG